MRGAQLLILLIIGLLFFAFDGNILAPNNNRSEPHKLVHPLAYSSKSKFSIIEYRSESRKISVLGGPSISVEVDWPYMSGYVSGTVGIGISVEDPDGLDTFVVYIDGEEYVYWPELGYPSDSIAWYWDSTKISDGSHTLRFWCNDTLGEANYVDVDVIVDNTPPDISFDVVGAIEIDSEYYLVGTVYLEADIVENNLAWYNISMYRFPDATPVFKKSWKTPMQSYALDTTQYPDYYYYLSIAVTDKAGNKVVLRWPDSSGLVKTFIIDNSPPEFTYLDPSETIYTRDPTYTVSWRASDISGIDHYEVKVGESPWFSVGLATEYEIQLVEGENIVKIKAVDILGHESIVQARIIRDVNPPEVSITAPDNGSSKWVFVGSARVSLIFQVADNINVSWVKILLDGEKIYEVMLGTKEASIELQLNLTTGRHEVAIFAGDVVGNTIKVCLLLYVNSYAPYVVGLGALTLAVPIVYLLIRKLSLPKRAV